jgi:ABC-type multidrug transport system ATPase subunit
MTTSADLNASTSGSHERVVRTDGLSKRYGSILAVSGVSLSVQRGEVYGFLGPNGAGKTTTLRMLLGLVRPTAGSAKVLGYPAGSPAGLARIGSMVETPALYPYLSGRDNLLVLAKQAGVPRPRIAAVLDTVGLAVRGGDRFASYSLGMKQRLGVAAALLKDPDLLILDEPTDGLDPLGMADMRALIRRLGDAGKAVMLSSHQLGEVEQICDRVGVIFRGRLVKEGTVRELRGATRLVIRATPLPQAEACLTELMGRSRVSVHEDELHVDAGADAAARVSMQLVNAGVDLWELRHDERSLEEAFLALSADDQQHAREDHAA